MLRKAVKATRAHLLPKRRNTLALINKLPPEVLQQIFAALPLCVHNIDNEVPLHIGSIEVITEVCGYWRRMAINTACLWTHIDLTVGSNFHALYQRSTNFFERSRGAPIHLHISDPSAGGYSCYEPQVIALTKHIAPHLIRIQSLDVHSRYHPKCLICPMNAFWLSNGSIGSTKALSIRKPGSNGLVFLGGTSRATPELKSQEHGGELLHSLSTLHLQNTYFPWSSSAYRGLIDLRLDFTGVIDTTDISVSQSTFADILSSSPQLATLKLSNLLITQTPDWNQSTSYRLGCLQVLNVLAMDLESLSLLLPMIDPPQSAGGLSVGMPAYTGNKFEEVVEGFFNRSYITTLHLVQHDAPNDIAHVMALLKHITGLERLSLRCSTPEQCTPLIPYDLAVEAEQTKRSFDLNELYIISKPVNPEKIQPLISMYGVQTLYLVGCEFHIGSSFVTFEEFRAIFLQTSPNTNCVLLPRDAIAKWPCCTIFGD
ncbi:hypothetical protein BDV93DRAFT_562094 [Ceratobasidium sp. AG-I]|nr:hypothetical protein BDV93DRAFT_562094 [Ceratobasidium sp. AG-I]